MSTQLTTACPGGTSGCTPYPRPDPRLAALVLEEAAQGLEREAHGRHGWCSLGAKSFPHVIQKEKMPAVSNRTDSTNLILSLSVLILFSVELSAEAQFVHQRRPWAGRTALSADGGVRPVFGVSLGPGLPLAGHLGKGCVT